MKRSNTNTIDYQTASLLKVLGFHENVADHYNRLGLLKRGTPSDGLADYNNKSLYRFEYSAPTIDGVITWLNEKLLIDIHIKEERPRKDQPLKEHGFRPVVTVHERGNRERRVVKLSLFSQYQSASEAAVIYAIRSMHSERFKILPNIIR